MIAGVRSEIGLIRFDRILDFELKPVSQFIMREMADLTAAMCKI
jgi:hypothetical protein